MKNTHFSVTDFNVLDLFFSELLAEDSTRMATTGNATPTHPQTVPNTCNTSNSRHAEHVLAPNILRGESAHQQTHIECMSLASENHSETTSKETYNTATSEPSTSSTTHAIFNTFEQQPQHNNKRKYQEKSEKTKRKKHVSEDEGSDSEEDGVKRISSSATYLELEPSGNRKREIIISIYKSKRNKFGPRMSDEKEFVKKMKMVANVKENAVSYVNTKGFLTKQFLLPTCEKTKVSLWVKFEGSDEFFNVYCQTGKGEILLMNLLTFDRNNHIKNYNHVNLNRYSNAFVKPECEFIEE
ncbi:predicted protein [Naegleria gruberi]|uniref:Predicted protein n=1 Tax=Naegleria gruberi TaxID=5762 RepID=D2VRT0_NAEGR|nr:uncharacterized protein NAEGRDRAFT_71692 [Naegleria gruberi]EFC40516.1 predicted protein [Naegleria gruberi]|eukprot:XP_002673260.1 predicted protein [Naegleria gruberi strain NEG-M]